RGACRQVATRRVKVETVERLCRKVLGTDPRKLYGEGFDRAWQHRGKRVNERGQACDHCLSSAQRVALRAAGGGGAAATTTRPTAVPSPAGSWRWRSSTE